MGYSTGLDFNTIFGVGPHMTLLDALSAKNKDVGSGVGAALMRHAVAALLNVAHPGVDYYGVTDPMWVINGVFNAWSDPAAMESQKWDFEYRNEVAPPASGPGCPLD